MGPHMLNGSTTTTPRDAKLSYYCMLLLVLSRALYCHDHHPARRQALVSLYSTTIQVSSFYYAIHHHHPARDGYLLVLLYTTIYLVSSYYYVLPTARICYMCVLILH